MSKQTRDIDRQLSNEAIASAEKRLAEMERKLHEERRQSEADRYAARPLTEELAAQTLAPQFADYISGETEAEVDAAIELATSKTAQIRAEIATQRRCGRSVWRRGH
jgi:hypothetical protein